MLTKVQVYIYPLFGVEKADLYPCDSMKALGFTPSQLSYVLSGYKIKVFKSEQPTPIGLSITYYLDTLLFFLI
jgi:hypothetical protein